MSADLAVPKKNYVPKEKTFKDVKKQILWRQFRAGRKTYVVLHSCFADPALISFLIKWGILERLGTIGQVAKKENWDQSCISNSGFSYSNNSICYLVKRRVKNLTVAKILNVPEGIPIPLDGTIECVKKVIKDRTFEIKGIKYAAIWYRFGVPKYVLKRIIELGYLKYAGKLREVVIASGITWDPNNYKDGNSVIAGNANVYKILKNPARFSWK
ncbi:MAG: hypothetical protein PHW01_02420 [Patescibacteria group bacterium]|nr:hypothetical protein [Patescibacteria group bacterium]